MGVPKLFETVGPPSRLSLRERFVRQQSDGLRPLVVAVDMSSWLVAAESVPHKEQHPSGPVATTVFGRLRLMLENGAWPICVFDGHTAPLKSPHDRRGNPQFNFSCAVAREVATQWGVPVVEAQGEAEASCAALVRTGRADAVLSSDSDALAYGAGLVLRFVPGCCTETDMSLDQYAVPSGEQQAAHKRFVLLAVIIGCDFYKGGVDGIGDRKAVDFVNSLAEWGSSVEAVVAQLRAGHGAQALLDQLAGLVELKQAAAKTGPAEAKRAASRQLTKLKDAVKIGSQLTADRLAVQEVALEFLKLAHVADLPARRGPDLAGLVGQMRRYGCKVDASCRAGKAVVVQEAMLKLAQPTLLPVRIQKFCRQRKYYEVHQVLYRDTSGTKTVEVDLEVQWCNAHLSQLVSQHSAKLLAGQADKELIKLRGKLAKQDEKCRAKQLTLDKLVLKQHTKQYTNAAAALHKAQSCRQELRQQIARLQSSSTDSSVASSANSDPPEPARQPEGSLDEPSKCSANSPPSLLQRLEARVVSDEHNSSPSAACPHNEPVEFKFSPTLGCGSWPSPLLQKVAERLGFRPTRPCARTVLRKLNQNKQRDKMYQTVIDDVKAIAERMRLEPKSATCTPARPASQSKAKPAMCAPAGRQATINQYFRDQKPLPVVASPESDCSDF